MTKKIKYKTDDYVVCVNDYDAFVPYITEGKIYKVMSMSGTGDIRIMDDSGGCHGYFSYRFKKIKNTKLVRLLYG